MTLDRKHMRALAEAYDRALEACHAATTYAEGVRASNAEQAAHANLLSFVRSHALDLFVSLESAERERDALRAEVSRIRSDVLHACAELVRMTDAEDWDPALYPERREKIDREAVVLVAMELKRKVVDAKGDGR
jgi:hypothetical protein